ncbi:IS3 family transposase [Streptomyces sp. NPDC056661]|uniref:IS3 family transposase n=1 Tax=Streptomyces sp. NPDC056661 TaxID=3345898 RepID=UPI00367CE513
MTGQIAAVHQHSRGTYAAPRIHAALHRKGAGCARRRIARLMRPAGLQGRHRRRRHLTTIPDPRTVLRPDLALRDFTPEPTAIDTRWRGNITYIPTAEGSLPSHRHRHRLRRAVGWATADHLRTDPVAAALIAACRQRRPTHPLVSHSDRGGQYPRQQFAAPANAFGVLLSVSRPGQCWNNALAESFFATIRRERVTRIELALLAWESPRDRAETTSDLRRTSPHQYRTAGRWARG